MAEVHILYKPLAVGASSTYQAQDHGEGKIEDSLPEGFWERGVMFPMKDAGTQIEIRRLKEDHGEGEG